MYSGVRMLDGYITDALEAQAIGHRNDYVDIYSCSWGPCDDGSTLEGPNYLASGALEHAIEEVFLATVPILIRSTCDWIRHIHPVCLTPSRWSRLIHLIMSTECIKNMIHSLNKF